MTDDYEDSPMKLSGRVRVKWGINQDTCANDLFHFKNKLKPLLVLVPI